MSDFMLSQVQGLLSRVADDVDKMGRTTTAQVDTVLGAKGRLRRAVLAVKKGGVGAGLVPALLKQSYTTRSWERIYLLASDLSACRMPSETSMPSGRPLRAASDSLLE